MSAGITNPQKTCIDPESYDPNWVTPPGLLRLPVFRATLHSLRVLSASALSPTARASNDTGRPQTVRVRPTPQPSKSCRRTDRSRPVAFELFVSSSPCRFCAVLFQLSPDSSARPACCAWHAAIALPPDLQRQGCAHEEAEEGGPLRALRKACPQSKLFIAGHQGLCRVDHSH